MTANNSNSSHTPGNALVVNYEFGEFVVDLRQRLLFRSGEEVYLAPKTFELLAYFLANTNRVIEKETLMGEVWPNTIVEEANLSVHVSNLRKALGTGKEDGMQGSVRIETFPKLGYRFSAEVTAAEVTGVVVDVGRITAELEESGTTLNHLGTQTRRDVRPRLLVIGLAAVLVVIFGAIALWIWKVSNPRVQTTMTRVPGTELARSIALSPNGEYIAQVIEDRGRGSLELLHLISGSSVQLLPPDEVQFHGITFSKDNSFLYFIKAEPEFKTLYKIPILGGTVTKVLDHVGSKLIFSPDGSRFCFVKQLPGSFSSIIVYNADGTGEREIARRTHPQFYEGWDISWSPDGKLITIVAGTGENSPNSQIVNVDLETGRETPLSDRKWAISDGLAWLPDETGLIAGFRELPTAITHVWLIPYPVGEPRKITSDVEDYGGLELSADGKTIMAGRFRENASIWIVPPNNPEKAEPVKAGRHHNFIWARWLEDGGIIFDSAASGNRDIWRIDIEGASERMLTSGPQTDWMPAPTADSRYIVFSAFRDNNGLYELWRMERDGSNQVQLTPTGGGAWQPSVTPDGKWVFYTSGEFDGPPYRRRLWKVPVEGGEPVIFTDTAAWHADTSPDGRLVACWIKVSEEAEPQAAVFSVSGGAPARVFDLPTGNGLRRITSPVSSRLDWTPDGKGFSFIRTTNGVSNIWTQPIDGGPPRQETQFTSETIRDFEWSKDGRLMCSRYFRSRDVVLIRNFR